MPHQIKKKLGVTLYRGGAEFRVWAPFAKQVFISGTFTAGEKQPLTSEGDGYRGGQATYHGPGQVVAYPLINLGERPYFVKEYVHRLEEAVIRTLGEWGLPGHRMAGAPGIYIRLQDPYSHAPLPQRPMRRLPGTPAPQPDFTGLAKISALGIKVSRQHAYHGVALNVDMALEPFERINPCGHAGLPAIDLSSIGVRASWDEAASALAAHLTRLLAP